MNAWDKRENESSEAYTRFLIFRNLGPTRNIKKSYQVASGQDNPKKSEMQTWYDLSSQWDWRERASQWDIAQLTSVVPETTGMIYQAVRQYALVVLEQLESGKYKPKSWSALQHALVTLTQLVSPEVIASAAYRATLAGDALPEEFRDSERQGDLAERIPQPRDE